MSQVSQMRRLFLTPVAVAAVALVLTALNGAGCATAPKSEAEREALVAEADAALKRMQAKDSTLRDFVDRAHGYAVFPSIGKGGAIVGGAYGRGVVYERGQPIGYAELNQGSVGLQLGGQTFSEVVVFENEDAMGRLRAGNFDVGAQASAVALKAGAAAATRFEDGVAIFVEPRGGLMAGVSVTGQKINFQPRQGGGGGGQ